MIRWMKRMARRGFAAAHAHLAERMIHPPRIWHRGEFITPVRRATMALLETWSPRISGRVLDVGVGRWTYPRRLLEDHCEYVATDCFEHPNIDVVSDLQALQRTFVAESFDVVICTNVLEHLPRPWLAVREMHAVLKPGGMLLLDTPFNFHLHGRGYSDYWRLSADALRLLLCEEAGFREVTITPVGPLEFPYSHLVVAVK